MKFAIMIILCILLSSCATPDRWTKGQKIAQGVYVAERVVDWGQTRYIVGKNNYWEKNRIMGENPSLKEVNNFFLFSTLIHASVTHILPTEYRRYWLTGTIVSQTIAIFENHSIGVKLMFW